MIESYLARQNHAAEPPRSIAPTLSAALDSCWEGRGRLPERSLPGRKPALQVIPEPFPVAQIWRGWGGAGRIVLSQGLVDLVDEDELRAVIRQGVLKIGKPFVPSATLCAAVDTKLRSRFFSKIRDGVNPIQALICWMLLPAVRILDRRVHRLDLLAEAPKELMQSIDRLRKIHGRSRDRLDWLI